MLPYHPANLKYQPHPHWRVILLAWIAKALGVQFKIGGMPYGGRHRHSMYQTQPDERLMGDYTPAGAHDQV